ncbi:MAG: hypothetical protein ACRDY0_04880 [Acidimicrobiales bacterium]
MAVREDCRHYMLRTTPTGEQVQRCRVGAGEESPFGCPEGCLFFEGRLLIGAGWAKAPDEPMSDTSRGLIDLPPRPKRRGKKKR